MGITNDLVVVTFSDVPQNFRPIAGLQITVAGVDQLNSAVAPTLLGNTLTYTLNDIASSVDEVRWVYSQPPGLISDGVSLALSQDLLAQAQINPVFEVPLTSSLIPLRASDFNYTFARSGANATVTDFEGLIKRTTANEARFVGARRVENLATGLVTQTITVINGSEYQLTIAGTNGSTAVCTGAFTGTLTADGTNRISWPSGTPKTSGSTSLTITVTGTLTQMLLEEVTGQTIQNPSENVVIGAEHGTNVGNVKYFDYQNNNTVDGSGVVTEAQGAAIPAVTLKGALVEEARTNIETYTNDILASPYSINQLSFGVAVPGIIPGFGQGGERLNPTNLTNVSRFTRNGTLNQTNGLKYCYSIIAETAGETWIRLYSLAGGTAVRAWFDIVNGVVGTVEAGIDAHGIEDLGSGRYLCWITVTGDGTNSPRGVGISNADNTNAYTPSSTSDGVYIYSCQLEQAAFPTSIIPSAGSITTRNAESLSYPNNNMLDDEGTFAVRCTFAGSTAQYAGGGDRGVISVRGENQDMIHIANATGKVVLDDNTGTTSTTALPAIVAGDLTRLASRWNATDLLMTMGQEFVESEVAFDGSMNKSTPIYIGGGQFSNKANGSYKDVRGWPLAVEFLPYIIQLPA